jgi:hypothetical protein
MPQFSDSIEIARPPEDVWRAIGTPERWFEGYLETRSRSEGYPGQAALSASPATFRSRQVIPLPRGHAVCERPGLDVERRDLAVSGTSSLTGTYCVLDAAGIDANSSAEGDASWIASSTSQCQVDWPRGALRRTKV